MAKLTHVHKLTRHKYKSGNIIFFCSLPDCSFKTNIALVLGKRSLCWRCGEEFIMNEYSLRLAKPHCDACHKPKKEYYEGLPEAQVAVMENIAYNDKGELTLLERLNQATQQTETTEEEEEI
jgi:hypothetical protein